MTEQEIARALAELRTRVRGAAARPSDQLSPLDKAVGEVNASWHVSARMPPPHPRAPRRWHIVYFVKRVIRRVMFEVLNALIEQQNQFNANTARAITELARQNGELGAQLADLARQNAELRARIAELERAHDERREATER